MNLNPGRTYVRAVTTASLVYDKQMQTIHLNIIIKQILRIVWWSTLVRAVYAMDIKTHSFDCWSITVLLALPEGSWSSDQLLTQAKTHF